MQIANDSRLLSMGICAFVFFSIQSRLDTSETTLLQIASILFLAYWMGSTYLKGLFVLFLILNPVDIVYMAKKSHLVLFQSLLYSMHTPGIDSISPGRAIYRSIRKKSILPILLSILFWVSVEIFSEIKNILKEEEGRMPMVSSSVVHLHSNSVYIHTVDEYYREYKRKQGSGNRKVLGNKIEPEGSGWKVFLDRVEGNPSPSPSEHIQVMSGSVIYLQDVRTKEYLQTSDVASPLTSSNQEVSTSKEISDNNKFIIIDAKGNRSKKDPILIDGYFFIKHVETGVFIRVIKRHAKNKTKGYEINGEKETGIDKNIGSASALWTGKIPHRKITIKALPKAIVRLLYTRWRNIALRKTEEEKRKKREKDAHPQNRLTICICIVLFSLAVIRGLFAESYIWEEVISCLADIVVFGLFNTKESLRNGLYCSSIIGIRHGLDIHTIVKYILKPRKIKTS